MMKLRAEREVVRWWLNEKRLLLCAERDKERSQVKGFCSEERVHTKKAVQEKWRYLHE